MHCHVCDMASRVTPAVATCQHCGVALCRVHLDEDLLAPLPRGLAPRTCSHSPVINAELGKRSAAPGRIVTI